MPRVRNATSRLMYEAKTITACYPRIALPVARLRWTLRPVSGEPFSSRTEIVIEGYPRSANSFAVHSFRIAQDRPIRISHHVHAPAQVIAAVRAHVPALVLIREPEDSVLEYVIARRYLSIRQALRGYLRFYATLLPHRDRFVVGPFHDVTTDFGAVIANVNRVFDTDFREFEHTKTNEQASFTAIATDLATRLSPGDLFERRVGRPSEVRDQLKEDLRASYRSTALAGLRSSAEQLHDTFISAAP